MKIYSYPIYANIAVLISHWLNHAYAETWSQSILAVAVLGNLATLAYKASKWRGYRPVKYGLAATILIFLANANPEAKNLESIGVLLLSAISAWTAWPPKNPGEKPPCCQ